MMQIDRIRGWAVAVAALLGMLALDATAARQPPSDRNDTVQATLDRGTPSGDVVVFDGASGGYDTDDYMKWGVNTWTCQSATDAATGACPTQPTQFGSDVSTTIKLSFKEEKTGATVVLNLYAESANARHRDCNGNIVPAVIGAGRAAIHIARFVNWSCDSKTVSSDERLLFLNIPAGGFKKLPSGGIWEADLKLNLRKWTFILASPAIAVFRAAITLNTTDKNNIQVYLPQFASAAPTVDLKLRRVANGRRMTGTANVDMCLYDGYNSQSTWFDVSASDGLAINRRDKGQYSVLLNSDKSGIDASRVDYGVSLMYAGKKIALPNSETVRLQGVNNSAGRSVSLPGISVPVVCTPTPLILETPEFEMASKDPGKYSSKLTITFTPSSASL
ncbi:pilin protein [Burkholderia stabilis]|uniref:Pilin protein n=2 Tax=Burkholderia stabilis TaxID=95485 RepID=A0A4V1PQI4_9BURK|nr:pilin protein [Burkholderia stabilis]